MPIALGVHFDQNELASLRSKLRDGGLKLYREPMQRLMRQGAVVFLDEALKRAPLSVVATLTIAPLTPRPWGVGRVRISAGKGGSGKSRNRSAVAAVLHAGGRGRRSVFRTGPRAGKPTKKWLHGVIRLAATKRRIAGLLQDASRDIGRIWSAR